MAKGSIHGGAIAVACLLLAAGCAQPGPQKLPRFEMQMGEAASTERWNVVRLPDEQVTVANVSDPSGQATFLVSCHEPSNTLMAVLASDTKLGGDPARRVVLLELDGGGFAMPNMIPRKDDGAGATFDIVYDQDYDYDFWPLIDNLQKHDAMVTIVKQDGSEAFRHRFSLLGAGDAIERVLKRCGKAERPRAPWL